MQTVETITRIDWLSHVGRPVPASAFSLKAVPQWQDAVAACSAPYWEEVCTEARNELTLHLNSVCKSEFQKWNEVVQVVKSELAQSWHRLRQQLEREGRPQIIADCAEWDTMHAAICDHYAEWSPPQFFPHLLSVYSSGHFPCGWDGRWPQGRLCVF